MAVSADGHYMATVDCMWASLNRILLKFWHWSEETSNYVLNTQVEFPHFGGVHSMSFQPVKGGNSVPMLLTVGSDKRAKLWQLETSWSCVSCFTFRQLAAGGGGWSSDGTIVGVAFGHIVTLWSAADMRLRTTLSLNNNTDSITSLCFGRNTCARFMYTVTSGHLVTWDLITLSPTWSLPLSPSPHTHIIQSETLPLLAIVQKKSIQIVSPGSKSIIHSTGCDNLTGGATWINNDIYALKYTGKIIRVTKETKKLSVPRTVMIESGDVQSYLETNRTVAKVENVQMMTRGRAMHDIESLLTLPLHTVPPPSQLSDTLVR